MHGDRCRAELAQIDRSGLHQRSVAGIEDQVAAFGREALGRAQADALGGAGDQYPFAGKSEVHLQVSSAVCK